MMGFIAGTIVASFVGYLITLTFKNESTGGYVWSIITGVPSFVAILSLGGGIKADAYAFIWIFMCVVLGKVYEINVEECDEYKHSNLIYLTLTWVALVLFVMGGAL